MTKSTNWHPDIKDPNFARLVYENLFFLRDQLQAISAEPKPPTLAEIQKQLQLGGSSALNLTGLLGASSGIHSGTHAVRVSDFPAAVYLDAIYVETDRNNLVYCSTGTEWIYVSGTYDRTQTQLAALAGTLGTSDTGLIVNVTNFAHTLRWTGTGWEWGPGDDHLAGMGPFFGEVDPVGAGWALYDGSSVIYLKSDGTTGTITLPNLCHPVISLPSYIKAGPTNTAIASGSGVTTSVSAGVPAGTVSQPTFSGNALATHQHEVPISFDSGGIYWPDTPPYGTGTSVTVEEYTIAIAFGPGTGAMPLVKATSGGTPSGTVSQPTFTGTDLANHAHGPNTLELQNLQRKAWFRQ